MVEFKIINERDFKDFLLSANFDSVVLTWTLHHMSYNKQIKYLKILYEKIKKGVEITILEDSFSKKLKPSIGLKKYHDFKQLSAKKQGLVMSFYDWVANRMLAQRSKVPIPFAYRTLEEWENLCKKVGFKIKTKRFIGFPDKRDIDTPQSLLIIKK